MKVAYCTKTFTRGGAASGNSKVADSLEKMGVNVLRLSSDDANWPIRRIREIERVFDTLVWSRDVHLTKMGPAHIDLGSVTQDHKPDIIQLGDISGNLIDYEFAAEGNCPVVHRLSDLFPYALNHHYFPGTTTLRRSLRKHLGLKLPMHFTPTQIVAPSEWIKAEIGKYRPELENAISIIPNAGTLEAAWIYRTEPNETISLGFVSGSVTDSRKGLQLLLDLLSKLSEKQWLSFKLHVFGDGTLPHDPDQVTMHGPFTKSKIPEVFDQIDILVVPSLLDNSPNVIIEAYENGKPVICSAATGAAEYVQDGVSGFIYDFWNRTESGIQFADHIKEIASNYESFARGAANLYDQKYSPSVVAENYISMYSTLL